MTTTDEVFINYGPDLCPFRVKSFFNLFLTAVIQEVVQFRKHSSSKTTEN